LSLFHTKVSTIKRDSLNPFFKKNYASLSNILNEIEMPLLESGLTFTQFPCGQNGLTTILCVGEKKRDEDGAYFAEVREQLIASLAKFPKAKVKQLIIAYEPIWAIGSAATRVATPDDLHEMVILIKKTLVHIFGKQHGFRVPILYGGSVDDQNALGFMTKGNADGLLVGRVSLDQKKFSNIIKLAESIQ
jgi:triosephosphate isomerase